MDATRNQISVLSKSQEDLEKSKDELVTKRNLLLHELGKIDKDIADADDKLSQIPSAIQKLEE